MTDTAIDRINAVLQQTFERDEDRRAALSAARAQEFSSVARTRDITRGRYGISILQARIIGGDIEIFARVFRDGVQVGFGKDGSVDVERFVIVNPPLLVSDAAGDVIRARRALDGSIVDARFRIDLQECLLDPLADMIARSSKLGARIISGKEGKTTYTIFGNTADGFIQSSNSTYATARSGGTLTTDASSTPGHVGQENFFGTFNCWEMFLSFTTSTVVGTISSAVLSLVLSTSSVDTAFTLNCRSRQAWLSTLADADYIAGASLSANTLLASIATGSISHESRNDLASQAEFLTNINQSGSSGFVLASSRLESGTSPPSQEYLLATLSDEGGTTDDPRLVIEAAVGGQPYAKRMGGVKFAGNRAGQNTSMWREVSDFLIPPRPSIIRI